jgi:LysM repeat protein
VTRNKGSSKDPSYAFKALIIVMALAFFFNLNSINQKRNRPDKEVIAVNNESSLFLTANSNHQDLSEITISQGSMVYASTPLFIPNKIQTLGLQLGQADCQKDIISYRVEPGETLSSIASKFNVSTNTIVWANELKGNSLKVNQDIIVLPVSGVFHMVKSGETVSSVAQRYKADKSEIVFCNQIENEKISVGDILIVPGGEMPKPVAPKASSYAGTGWLIVPASGYISQGLHWHNAIDIANNCGTPIYAAGSGKVQQTGYHGVAGNYIRIIHSNGVVTFYGHLSRFNVSSGQNVAQGALIGYMGNTGFTIGPTGCHLHFEVRGAANPLRNFRVGHRF